MRVRNVLIVGTLVGLGAYAVQRTRGSNPVVGSGAGRAAADTPAGSSQRLEPADAAQRFGAAAAADAELADRLVAETGGDLEEAEPRFDAEATGPVSTEVPQPRVSN